MDTPDKSLVPHVPALAVYSLCFGLGWLLHRQAALMEDFARLTPGRLALCVFSVLASIVLARFQGDPGHPHIDLIRAGFVVSYALMMWSLVVVCIGLFKRFLDHPRPVVRYLADASYWLYLVHLPLVVWLQVTVAEWPVHWTFKLTGIFFATAVLSLIVYDLLVRPTSIGRVLNGRQKQSVLITSWTSRSGLARSGEID